MSSSESSSSSRSQRPPLHERSESEKNKLQIRIVPYSPPRPSDADTSRSSGGPGIGIGSDNVQNTANEAAITTPRTTRARAASYGKEGHGVDPYSSYSSSPFSTPASPLARAKGRGVSGSKLASDSSSVERTERTAPPSPVINRPSYGSNIRRINPQSQSSHSDDGSTSPTWNRSLSRREKFINVHSDKTFSVVLKTTRPRNSDRSDSTLKSPLPSNTSTISSHEESSFDVSAEDRFGSPLSSVPERSISPSSPSSPSTPGTRATAAVPEFPVPEEFAESSSPWNYRMVGGLRKVPKTPDLKGKGKEKDIAEEPPLPPLPLTIITPPEPEPIPSSPLATKQSFNSEQTASTIEETTNYKVLGRSSPPLPDTDSIDLPDLPPLPSSSISPNYEILGQSSPAQTIASSVAPPAFTSGFTDTPGSKNYIVYGDTSPAASSIAPFRGHRYHSSDESSLQQVRPSYSQESLVVPPLRPHKRSSSESLGYYQQRSRENLRGRANSFSSLSSIISQDTASLYSASTPNVVILRHTPSTSSIPRSTWAAGPSNAGQQRVRMDAHQWSSQLSTVMSEYEGSDPGSRVVSGVSNPERVSSAFGSRDSRQMRSISSSLGLDNIDTRGSRGSHSRSNSRSDSLDRPSPVYARNGRDQIPSPGLRTVRDHDEHGDGLADLQQLQSMPSRTRLGFSRQSSERSLRSTTSSRAGSLTSSSLPSWARLYYGSGERRWWASSIRSVSEAGESRPASPNMGGGSPSHDQFSQSIFNPRRRPKDIEPQTGRPSSMEIAPAAESGSIRLAPKKKTSSIWSPHLRLDTRASRFSIWNAPSVTWSADSGVLGKRNIQVVLFLLGFMIPFAWMIAAFLPLPPKPMLAMDERDRSTTGFHSPRDPESHQRRHVLIDDSRYQSARWWRNVNRFMSVAGLLIIGAVAALVVIGVRQRWTQ
ncbi:hypothetical protein GGR53DRAFT_102301 [Hypoxylon sp. FL1150]|nr:hypothetical protein GGR53DRAFT_102301 [Hypoxylon sp. FL1150]